MFGFAALYWASRVELARLTKILDAPESADEGPVAYAALMTVRGLGLLIRAAGVILLAELLRAFDPDRVTRTAVLWFETAVLVVTWFLLEVTAMDLLKALADDTGVTGIALRGGVELLDLLRWFPVLGVGVVWILSRGGRSRQRMPT